MLNFSRVTSVHFIGVGGVSMSSLALLMLKLEKNVSGSDRSYNNKLDELTEAGANVWVGSEPDKINADIVVYSSAVQGSDAELSSCRKRGITCLERFAFLGEVSSLFKHTVAVAGTHGKTTVTSMIVHVLKEAGAAFFGHIGGDAVGIGNFYLSGFDFFVTEACEYRKSLLALRPDIALVLNAENDHPDTYANLSEIYDTFDTFLDNARGLKITDCDTEYFKARQIGTDCVTYGKSGGGFCIGDVCEYEKGRFSFSISQFFERIAKIRLKIYGEHNVGNAAACFAVCRYLGLKTDIIVSAIESFKGVKRRFEERGFFMGAKVICDYAHHPSEIIATVKTAKEITVGRLICVFQPHTFSRTAALFEEFSHSFSATDAVIICKSYGAREDESKGLTAKSLYDAIVHEDKHYKENVIDISCLLKEITSANDTILVLGAGDIDVLCDIIS